MFVPDFCDLFHHLKKKKKADPCLTSQKFVFQIQQIWSKLVIMQLVVSMPTNIQTIEKKR